MVQVKPWPSELIGFIGSVPLLKNKFLSFLTIVYLKLQKSKWEMLQLKQFIANHRHFMTPLINKNSIMSIYSKNLLEAADYDRLRKSWRIFYGQGTCSIWQKIPGILLIEEKSTDHPSYLRIIPGSSTDDIWGKRLQENNVAGCWPGLWQNLILQTEHFQSSSSK